MKHILSALLIPALLLSSTPSRAQSPQAAPPSRFGGIAVGVPVRLESPGRADVEGTVSRLGNSGFWIEPASASTAFVKYSAFRFEVDRASGVVVGRPAPHTPTPGWVKGTLITIAVFAGVAIATQGMFPGCLFERCLR
jgi:hypothetical protein